MIENTNEMTEELKNSNGEEYEHVTKSIKSAFWPKKPYSAEAEVKKLRKQLQEKKDLIRELKKDKKDLYRRIWEKNDLNEAPRRKQRGIFMSYYLHSPQAAGNSTHED